MNADTDRPEPGRHYRCRGCLGVVSIPERRRTITIAQVTTVHEDTCPGLNRAPRPRREKEVATPA